MNWGRAGSILTAVAVAMILVANAPPILVDPLVVALTQVRGNISNNSQPVEQQPAPETDSTAATLAKKARKLLLD